MVPQIPRKSEPPTLWEQPRERAGNGPQLTFAAALFIGAATWIVAPSALSPDAVMPAVSTVFLVLAGVLGMIAWRRGRMDPGNVTYADAAGALTLIGLCAAATIDPDQLLRLTTAHRE